MSCFAHPYDDSSVLVGDPVDVISGANVDRTLDFQLTGPIRFLWIRHYDSSQNNSHYALGWGHTHEYDHWLRFDVDGIRYTGVLGRTIGFPPLQDDGQRFARRGFVLHRLAPRVYRLYRHEQPTLEFEFGDRPFTPMKRVLRRNSEIHLHYDDKQHLIGITDSQRRYIQVASDDAGRILGFTLEGPKGKPGRVLLAYRYDEAGNLVAGQDPYGSSFSFRYDDQHRMLARTDRIGYSFLFDYDKQGRCIRSVGEDGLLDTRLQYHAMEKVTVVTRADGGVWTYLYPTGKLTRIIDPYGASTEFKRDETGRISEEIDANGNVTRRVYDSRGALIRRISPLNRFMPANSDDPPPDPNERLLPTQTIEWEYGHAYSKLRRGEAISLPRLDDVSLREIPERIRQEIRVFDLDDTAGHVTGPFLPPGQRQYDDFGRLVKEGGPDGTFRRWLYDGNGNILRITDRDSSQYRYKYASWDLRTIATNPLGSVIGFQYTRTQKLRALRDRGGSISEYEHDLKGRLVCIRRHGVVKERYRYDNADNLVEKLDGQGMPLLTFEVGPGNVRKTRHLASGETHAYGYDENGRLLSAATETAEVLLAYDRVGNRVRDERNGLGITHRFGPSSCPIETKYFGRYSLFYRHLGNGKMLVTDPRGVTHTIEALGNGLVRRRLGNGSSEIVQFNESGRCLMKATTRRRTELWLRKYSYSGEGDLLLVDDNVRGTVRYVC